MNKPKIEYCDYTWNPMTGCKHGCEYCYARKIAERFRGTKAFPVGFDPIFYGGRLDEPGRVKKPSKIFVCSMADLFGEWVPSGHIRDVRITTRIHDHHTYQFLTKNPKRYMELSPWLDNCWLGASATNQEMAEYSIKKLGMSEAKTIFLSLEPLLGTINLGKLYAKPDWIIVGAQTGPGAEHPPIGAVAKIRDQCKEMGIPVFFKDNLKLDGLPKEFPK